MELKEQLTQSLSDAVVETFSSVLSLMPKVTVSTDSENAIDMQELISSIGLAGALEGSLAISFSKVAACTIVSKMLCADYPEITQDVIDGVGEVANIIAGGLKTRISQSGYVFEISIPTVIQSPGPMHIANLVKTDNIKLNVDCTEFRCSMTLSFQLHKAGGAPSPAAAEKKQDASEALKNLF